MKFRPALLAPVCVVVALLCGTFGSSAQQYSTNLHQSLRWRCIGPCCAGRTVGAVGLPAQPKDENTGAIQIEFDPANPQIIYADLFEARHGPWENGSESFRSLRTTT